MQRSVARRDRSLLTTPELFKSLDDLVGLEVGIVVPVRRPDAHEVPAEAVEHCFAQAIAVAVAVALARMECGPIAFDARQKAFGVVGVAHAEVDAKAGDADLHLHVEAARPEPRSDLVDHEQVERQRAGLDEPGQGERRHHETRLKGLHALAGTCQDLTHRR